MAEQEREHPSTLGLVWVQFRATQRLFWRNPAAAFFTFVFPLFFLFLFNSLFGGGNVELPGGVLLPYSQVFTPSIVTFAVATACFTNLAIGVSFARDQGVLKRMRGTPLPPWIYLAGRIASSMWISVLSTVIMLAVGVLAYDVQIYVETLPALTVALVVGAACFCSLGLAASSVSPNADATPAVANAIILPMAFLAGVFIPLENAPDWFVTLGKLFPLRHFVDAFSEPLNPFHEGNAFEWVSLAILLGWFVAGLLFDLKFFRWEPKEGGGRKRKRRGGEPLAATGGDG
jgi:ABC-2 type transport system permease protein